MQILRTCRLVRILFPLSESKNMNYTSRAHWEQVANTLASIRPKQVYITTYSMWTAISNWPNEGLPPRMSPIQQVMTYMNNIKVDAKIIIGIASETFNTDYNVIKQKWPNIQIRYIENNHSKSVIINEGYQYKAWIGSCNMNDSTYQDISVQTSPQQAHELFTYFNRIWGQSKGVPQ